MPVPVVSLNIYDVGPTTMHVQWQPVGGATGYTLSHQPVNAPEPTKPKEVTHICFFIIGPSETLQFYSPHYTSVTYELVHNFTHKTEM